MTNPYLLPERMAKDVWLEWQQLWNMDPWDGNRADLRNGILAQAVYHAMYGAVNRVIAALAGGKDDFDYDLLPKAQVFMPYRPRTAKDGEGEDEPEDRGADRGDGRPLDPNLMTPAQWERHRLEIDHWNQYLMVRMAAQGATPIREGEDR